MPKLIKRAIASYIPADPGSPGSPYVAAQPARTVVEPRTTCTSGYTTSVYCQSTGLGIGNIGQCYSFQEFTGVVCTTTNVRVYYPATAEVAAVPARPPTAAQLSYYLNEGWNTSARTIGALKAAEYFQCTVKLGTRAAFLAVGPEGRDGQLISAFTHGVMVDSSGITVFENGVPGAVLAPGNTPGLTIRIARLSNGRILYSVDSVFSISAQPLYNPTDSLYVYGLLYAGWDEVSSAEFKAGNLLNEPTITMSGRGVMTAYALAQVTMAGSGVMSAQPVPVIVMTGSGVMTAIPVVERQPEITMAGTGFMSATLVRGDYADIVLQAFQVQGGDYEYSNGAVVLAPFTMSAGEPAFVPTYGDRGYMNLAFPTVWGSDYETVIDNISLTLERFIMLGGDYEYGFTEFTITPSAEMAGSGVMTVYALAKVTMAGSGVMSAQPVPAVVMSGSGVMMATPTFELLSRPVGGRAGTGMALPLMFMSATGDFIASDEMVLISPMLLAMSFEQQIDLVMIFTSTGQLESAQAMTRLQALELLSAMQAASVLDMLGVYGYSFQSDMQGLSVQTLNIGTRPDLYAGGVIWAINRETGASSQYEQYGFNSFFQRAGKYYGVADDGIYLLEGDTDAGSPIDALIELGRTNLGYTSEKRVRNVYLGVGSSNELYLKVDVDNQTYVYSMRTSGQAVKNRPVEVGWGVKGDYWDFTLVNPNGADFNLASISFMPIPLARRG